MFKRVTQGGKIRNGLAIIGVLTLVFSCILGFLSISDPKSVQSAIFQIYSMETARPGASTVITATLEPFPTHTPTATPFTTLPTMEPQVATAGAMLTATAQAIAGGASSPTPTALPSTGGGPGSGIGDGFSDERVMLTLKEAQFNPEWFRGAVTVSYAIHFGFEFVNRSGEEILLRFAPGDDFSLADYVGGSYRCTIPFGPEEVSEVVKISQTYVFFIACGAGESFGKEVDAVGLLVQDFSSLGDVFWNVDVPK